MIGRLLVVAAVAAIAIGAAPAASADPVADLFAMLPPGYGEGSCHPAEGTLTESGALAMAECSNNSLPGGPNSARYTLFSDVSAMNSVFADLYRSHHFKAGSCPGMTASPASWTGRNAAGGSIACGAVEGDLAAVVWTNDSGPLVALATGGSEVNSMPGPDVNGLWQWWSDSVRRS